MQNDGDVISAKLNSIGSIRKNTQDEIFFLGFSLKLKILQDTVEQIQENTAASGLGILQSNMITYQEIIK